MVEKENVVLITEQDEPIGLMEKQEAHVAGVLHRAFSVFIFNDNGELLIQQRAFEKYHTPGKWTNTCCSHPRDGETYEEGAIRRLQEEMGFTCPIEYQFNFIYKADVGQGLTEHELDYVFKGVYNEEPVVNPEEVAAYKWIDFDELQQDVQNNPEEYTPWFRIILKEYLAHLS
ncbi:isopentenyl-diphosphate Delta-isomerase [Weeksellaceae bacterium KMM 9713]|uniref:Isopentenyl-diphosphate delta-isomerase n=1 Tax=Profundicola chukchiensis TaxID=2961959 RepID=A0A9X4N411_9FLAO|nr:isopentenyl-diphosphate Delta-isomerase [Profundicola chukchiensis]MDG4946539.1 isopentenyl-diphosphate Delta-isomerase [Profundicola chukchiensis]